MLALHILFSSSAQYALLLPLAVLLFFFFPMSLFPFFSLTSLHPYLPLYLIFLTFFLYLLLYLLHNLLLYLHFFIVFSVVFSLVHPLNNHHIFQLYAWLLHWLPLHFLLPPLLLMFINILLIPFLHSLLLLTHFSRRLLHRLLHHHFFLCRHSRCQCYLLCSLRHHQHCLRSMTYMYELRQYSTCEARILCLNPTSISAKEKPVSSIVRIPCVNPAFILIKLELLELLSSIKHTPINNSLQLIFKLYCVFY